MGIGGNSAGRCHENSGKKMKILLRIILDIGVVVAILNGWWPVAIILVLIGAWFFRFYIEMILAGVAYDALFNMAPHTGWIGYEGTIIAVIIFIIVRLLKRMVR